MKGSAVTSIGGLLPRDLLDRVTAADPTLPGMGPTDYGLAPGERLNDAVTRSWNRLRGIWETFRRAEADLPTSDQTATSLTRERWLRPLLDELGFAGLPVARGLVIGGKDYPISHQWGSTVPVHLPGARVTIDRATKGVPGAAHTSPHGLVQEFLNRSDVHLWGIVSNGRMLRILRDNASLTRQAFVEFDLQAIFDGEGFSDFVLLWLCCHRTRFEGEPAEKCLLEQWTNEAATAGTRALERLRTGVEEAIAQLGEGFVAHPANSTLRTALRDRDLTSDDLKNQLLRLVYRLLFLLVAESRDLLLDPQATETARQRYRSFYSIERIRALAVRRRGTTHDDLWAGLRITMSALGSAGAPEIGLAPLGSFLWSADAMPALAAAAIDNRHFLEAVRKLCFTHDAEARALRPVDYRNLGAEELGSIYEALLELHAEVDPDARTFALATAAGNERKTTGSYYTPTSLIRVLLDSALDPVLDEADSAPDPEAAILNLKILDPAAGSGHFLIAAAHRIAGRLALVRCGGVEPAPADLRRALREVIARCIYAIDINPMAVELCKVSLWMEATEPGRPLSFLDHHVVCGNSLLGTTPALLEAGLPDDAFKPIEGDDKTWGATLRSTNKRERANREQGTLDFSPALIDDLAELANGLAELQSLDETTLDVVSAKEARFAELQASQAARRAKFAADAWCAAFVAPKVKGAPVLTDGVVRTAALTPEKVAADVTVLIRGLDEQYRFLHLHVAFPDVFTVPEKPSSADIEQAGWSGGFDVVLGNPPWDKVELNEQQFFAVRDPDLARLAGARRKHALDLLRTADPTLHGEYLDALREKDGERHLLTDTGRYPLCGRGKVNTFSVFAELMRIAISRTGRVGVIVPTAIATDDTTKFFFADLVARSSIVSLFDFENRHRIFPAIHSSMKFALLTLAGDDRPAESANFVFFAHEVADVDNPEKRFSLQADDFVLMNPITRTCPVFRTQRDAEINKGIHRRIPVLDSEDPSAWDIGGFSTMNAGEDSTDFIELDSTSDEQRSWASAGRKYLRWYEAKMATIYNHRSADVRISEEAAIRQNQSEPLTLGDLRDPSRLAWSRNLIEERVWMQRTSSPDSWYLAWRDLTSGTNERTMVPVLLPRAAFGRNNLPSLTVNGGPREKLALYASWASFVLDYVARNKVNGIHMTIVGVRQLPCPTLVDLQGATLVVGDPLAWISMRVLELCYTAWDLHGLAADLAVPHAPFRWDEERRPVLRAELDALMFRLYGIGGADVSYILDTFPIVKRKDEAGYGEFRTKRLILERYNAMAEAEVSGRRYQTVLDPPPAHPSLAHPESTRPDWARPAKGH